MPCDASIERQLPQPRRRSARTSTNWRSKGSSVYSYLETLVLPNRTVVSSSPVQLSKSIFG
jgi:hypothetical protein